MNATLFQPRTPSVRAIRWSIGAICGLAVAGGILGVCLGWMSFASFLIRAAMIVLTGLTSIWAYTRLKRAATSAKAEHLPWIHAATASLGISMYWIAFSIIAYDTRFGGAMPMSMISFVAGGTLAMAGWGRRVGSSMHCPTCEYEFGFAHTHEAPIRCPECGNAWLGRLKQGRKVRSFRVVALGVFLAIFGFIVLSPIFWINSLAPYLPTPVLYSTLYMSPRGSYLAWDELGQRRLSPTWTRVMGERVLAIRGSDRHDRSPGKWFESAAKTDGMPAALLERFYTEGFKATLAAPPTAKAGEPITVSLRVRQACDADNVLGVMLAGYAVDDAEPIVGRHTRTLWSHELDPGVLRPYKDAHTATLRIATPGTHRIRSVCWLIYQKSFIDQLEWQADGTPAPPPFAAWFRRVELETTIIVE